MRIGGIVLCGGKSVRMGRPKAWLPFGRELMLPRVVRLLREVVSRVVVVAAPGQAVPPLPSEVEVARDEVVGCGPMSGFATGLAALEGRVEVVYLTSCDVPFLKPAVVQCVLASLGEAMACVLNVGGTRHPLAAAYGMAVLPEVQRMLAAGRLRMQDIFDLVPTRVIEEGELQLIDPAFRSLWNMNSPEEYEAALREVEEFRV